jgi:UDP-N-acetylmuramoylalanine--D-glutamate ligase
LVKKSVRTVVAIGEDAENIASQLRGQTDISIADTFEEGVRQSFDAAQNGDTVLLAPACASFDMFRSFEQRGTVFKSEVAKLRKSSEGSKAQNV